MRTFSPRWKHSHLGGNTSHRGGNILTAVGMFSPRWECSHPGGKFSPRWECSHRSGKFSPRWECFHSGENVLTAVRMWDGMNGVACRHEMVARESVVTYHVTSHRGGNTSHHGRNVLTVVGMFPPRWRYFSPRWEYSHRGGNDSTAVRTFPPR